jgi:hypothetical protein
MGSVVLFSTFPLLFSDLLLCKGSLEYLIPYEDALFLLFFEERENLRTGLHERDQ